MLGVNRVFTVLLLVSGVFSQQSPAPKAAKPAVKDVKQDPPAPSVGTDSGNSALDCTKFVVPDTIKPAGTVTKEPYLIQLKLPFANQKDFQEVIMVAKAVGITPNITFNTKEYDFAFTAQLTDSQFCQISTYPKVGMIDLCTDQCDAEAGPPTIPRFADLAKLPEACASAIYYMYLNVGATPFNFVPETYRAGTKPWVTKADADKFFKSKKGTISKTKSGIYTGKWSLQDLCDIEKNEIVTTIEPKFVAPAAAARHVMTQE